MTVIISPLAAAPSCHSWPSNVDSAIPCAVPDNRSHHFVSDVTWLRWAHPAGVPPCPSMWAVSTILLATGQQSRAFEETCRSGGAVAVPSDRCLAGRPRRLARRLQRDGADRSLDPPLRTRGGSSWICRPASRGRARGVGGADRPKRFSVRRARPIVKRIEPVRRRTLGSRALD